MSQGKIYANIFMNSMQHVSVKMVLVLIPSEDNLLLFPVNVVNSKTD